ncbi:uncharacterized protein YebE (UPF0316 family) [Desulfitispora alkaliphila]|uniref:DUF2179 domain-containing protein n=1 Tax=Desulfitispora alkaliphila TaxID=622674 RepID=UPI003D1CACE8
MALSLILGYAFIFGARVADVALAVVRTLMLVKGKRFTAAALGFFEVIIFIIALDMVVQDLDNPIKLLFYGLGFATGNIVGSYLEEKLAMGHITVQVITMSRPLELTRILREQGYGVTVIEGHGRQGKRMVLNIICTRKEMDKLISMVEDFDAKAFVTVFEARATKGGIFNPITGKRK